MSGGKNYRAHVFASTGTFSNTGNLGGQFDYLVIAGGGGGGGAYDGGGGAGGYRTSMPEAPGGVASAESKITFVARYNVFVGAGGAGGGVSY